MGRFGAPKFRASGSLAALALLVAACALQAQDPAPAVFSVDVRLVTLPTTVKDAHGAPIGDLEREDFTIFEEGEERELAVFERRTSRPLSVALMIDASLSTAIALQFEREAAGRFLEGLLAPGSHPSDRAAVLSFSADVEVLQPFTRDLGDLRNALRRVRPQTGTSVYDAVLLASQELRSRAGRRVIVLITDGGDTTSYVRYADALRRAQDAEVAIYPLIVLPIQSDAGRNRGGEHALITLAKQTGGEHFVQHGVADLDEAFGEVLRSLRTQYLLGYYPGDFARQGEGEDDFRQVEVKVKREGAVVLVRSGFYARPAMRPERFPVAAPEAPVRLRSRPRVPDPPESGLDSLQPLAPRRSEPGQERPSVLRPDL